MSKKYPMDLRTFLGGPEKRNNKPPINPTNALPKGFENLPDIYCTQCLGKEFILVQKMKYMSKIASPNGLEGTVNITVQVCANPNCKKPWNLNEWKKINEEKTIIIPTKDKES